MLTCRLTIGLALLAVAAIAPAQTIIDPQKGLLVGTLVPSAQVKVGRSALGGYQVNFPTLDSNVVVKLPTGTSWVGYSHVDIRIRNNSPTPTELELDCSSQNGAGWLTSSVVLGVGEKLDLSVPLTFAADLGLRVLPGISDAPQFQTASSGKVYLRAINGFFFWNKGQSAANVTIESMSLTKHANSSVAFVDTFGQQTRLTWPGKIATVDDMIAAKNSEVAGNSLPYAADSFGGITGSTNYGASTAFRTIKQGGRWFLVTPLGNRFFSLGVNEIGSEAWTPVDDHANMFTDLANIKSAYPELWSVREGQYGFVPYEVNLARKYGKSWRATSEKQFVKRLKTWGFNTIGINSWDTMVSNQQITSTFGGLVEGVHGRFVAYDGRTMHDVFDPQFYAEAKSTCETRILETGGANSKNLGIFLDNELPWGNKLSSDVRYRYALAVGSLNATATYSHRRLIVLLRARYANVAQLNAAWGSTFASWAALENGHVAIPTSSTDAMIKDFSDFGYLFAQKYFSSVKTALTELNYKGLYLGCRFTATEVVPEVLKAAKESCDVISVNIYNASPTSVCPELKSLDCPLLISEFAFGATDLGRVGVPLYATQTETARVDAYKRFMAEIQTWPNIVGAHWYRWEDFPATGKLEGGDNMSMGLVSITDSPYTTLTAQTKASAVSLMAYLKKLP